LAEENALLEEARQALTRSDAAHALRLLERHQHRFKKAQLVEEREALWVRALLSAGQARAARERAAHFEHAHPGSLLLPSVQQALRKAEAEGSIDNSNP
jgi:outer membrane protein assembly factor BamD (BamD/ComL family)